MTVGVTAHSYRLYNGCRSFYFELTWFRRTWWIQRWDTARCPENRFRQGPMGWTWGRRWNGNLLQASGERRRG